MDRWLYAVAALAAGVLVGSVAGWAARKTLGDPSRRSELREIARPTGAFLFWLGTATGIVIAIGLLRPGTLEFLPGQLLSYLPRILVAGLILIAGYVLAPVIAVAVGGALSRASGERHHQIARVIRASILGATIILALSQLGIDTTILTIAIAAIVFSAGAAVALLVGLGGQDVAREVAAGRYIRSVIEAGDAINTGELQGVVVALHPATLEIETLNNNRVHIPYSHLLAGGFQTSLAEEHSDSAGEGL
jgi:hypothetical protein